MAVAIFGVYIAVVIDKIFVAGIVWWIYIDYIYLAFVGVSKCGKGFEIISFDKYMVRRIGIVGNDATTLNLPQNRKFVTQTFNHIFRLIFPNKAISFVLIEKSEKCRAFIIRQSFQGFDAVYQFSLVSRIHGKRERL